METKLQPAIDQVVRMPAARIAGEGAAVFNLLSRAILQIAGSAEAGGVLDSISTKAEVVAFLSIFHEQKRIYRKQVSMVVRVLAEVESWKVILAEDKAFVGRLPPELRCILGQDPSEQEQAEGSAGQPSPAATASSAPATLVTPDPPRSATTASSAATATAAAATKAGAADSSQDTAPLHSTSPPSMEPLNSHGSPVGSGHGRSTLENPVQNAVQIPVGSTLVAPVPSRAPDTEVEAEATPTTTTTTTAMMADTPSAASASGRTLTRQLSTREQQNKRQEEAAAWAAAQADQAAHKRSEESFHRLQSEVETSFRRIRELRILSEEGPQAFTELRKPMMRVGSLAKEDASELLGELEPKIMILSFLIDFFSAKKMYRTQILSVFTILMQVVQWIRCIRFNPDLRQRFPPEFESAFVAAARESDAAEAEKARASTVKSTDPSQGLEGQQETEAADHPSSEPPPTSSFVSVAVEGPREDGSPAKTVRVHMEDVRKAIRAAERQLPVPPTLAPKTPGQEAARLLAESCAAIEAFVAAKGDCEAAARSDGSIEIFEKFQRAVSKAKNENAGKDNDLLESVRPKRLILEFLLALSDSKKRHRGRVISTVTILMSRVGWEEAAEESEEVQSQLERLLDDHAGIVQMGDGTTVNVKKLAANLIESKRGIGILAVKVYAAYDLVARDPSGRIDPLVKVTVGAKSRKTEIICDEVNPKWNSFPFIFEVATPDDVVKFEVFDSYRGQHRDQSVGPVGTLCYPAAQRYGRTRERSRLTDAERGELLVELHFEGQGMQGTDSSGAPAGLASPRARLQEAVEAFEGGATPQSAEVDLRCPNGHPVTKRKERLRWHQKMEIWIQQRCDLCEEAIAPDVPRWRCHYHCDFDVCEECFAVIHGVDRHQYEDACSETTSITSTRSYIFNSFNRIRRSTSLRSFSGGRRGSTGSAAAAVASQPSLFSVRNLSFSSRNRDEGDNPIEILWTPDPERLAAYIYAIQIEDGAGFDDGIIYYRVKVTPRAGHRAWDVMRRYNDFYTLQDRLGPQCKTFNEAPFPGKTYSPFSLSEQQLEERRAALEIWLRKVLERQPRPIYWTRALDAFFGHRVDTSTQQSRRSSRGEEHAVAFHVDANEEEEQALQQEHSRHESTT